MTFAIFLNGIKIKITKIKDILSGTNDTFIWPTGEINKKGKSLVGENGWGSDIYLHYISLHYLNPELLLDLIYFLFVNVRLLL